MSQPPGFDDGGYLPTGLTIVRNAGLRERVWTRAEIAAAAARMLGALRAIRERRMVRLSRMRAAYRRRSR